MYTLKHYDDNNFRIICTKSDFKRDIEKSTKDKDDYYIPQVDSNEIERIELSRAKRMIKEYALCNDFKYFFTATVSSEQCDRFSLSETQKKIRYLIKERIRRKDHNCPYLFITEKHDKGGFHFHRPIW